MKSFFSISFIKKFLPGTHSRLVNNTLAQKIQSIQQTAEEQKQLILQEATRVLQEQVEKNQKLLDEQIEEKQVEIQLRKKNLSEKQSRLDQQLLSVHNQDIALAQKSTLLEDNQKSLKEQSYELNHVKNVLENELEKQGLTQKSDLLEDIKSNLIKTHIAEVSRLSFERQEQLKIDAQKLAQKALQSVYYRYQPRFVWPKSSFLVEFTNSTLIEKYFAEDSQILKFLLEGTDTTLSVLETSVKNQFAVKIVGGLGVDKETIRLTLEECGVKKILNPDKILSVKNKHAAVLEHQILNMGSEAAKILSLQRIHPEILKLIGSLNFRTSHRQNQYYHSLEVATLAGMIAHELGVEESLAKRSGILHDIGKVLDYKIEGGHAVISGDYAARFNEHDAVVDTVLAHHDDKIVETPHAFILKAADAMSGARPGARVDMEDGYNRRLDGISAVVQSFQDAGVTDSAIMHAGREVHVYVDNRKTSHTKIDALARDIAAKLESEVEYPGQIRVTVIRRMEITAVA